MDILSSDSDWESSSDSGSSDGTEELEFLYHGHANNILSSLEETIGKIDDFLSFEREFTRGDIVQSVSDPHGQMGRVIKVNTFVDLENVHGKIIKDVDSKKLLKIRTISEEDYVVQGPWIGRVINVIDKVSVLFEDGTKCEVLATDNEKPTPLSPNLLEDSSYPYYPGQRVQFGLSTASKSARWLCGAWKENHNVGTIIAVKAGLVDVHWLGCAIVGSQSFPSPQCSQDAENLTLLSCFSHENWRLGDWCILPKADSNYVKETIAFRGSILELIKEHRNLGKGFKKHDFHSNLEEIFSIVRMKTMVDVVWKDGDCSLGLDSESLLPIDTVNAHEFWPGQFVLDKGICDDPSVSGNQKWGVVIAVDSKEQTVKVKWKSDGVSQENNGSSNQKEEIVSAYELVEHPDYTFCFGDVVFRNTNLVDKCHVKLEKVSAEDVADSGKGSGADQIGCPYEDFLSCIGHVTGFKNGSVEVTWASGVQTEVAPYHIFQINKYEGLTSPLIGQDGEASQQDMVDQEKQVPIVKTKELVDTNSIGKEQKRYPQECTSFFLPQSTIGFFKGIAASIFGSFASTSLSGSISTGHVSKEEKGELEAFDLSTEMQPLVAGQVQRCENASVKEVIDDIPDNEELESSSSSLIHSQFKQFDMVGDCSDHHFLDCLAKGVALSQVKKGWLKKVQQEWSVLEKDLPESIYVRIYEERMDLIRAAIIGAPGTPYHDGLFFFDIYLPPEYPNEPPLVHYHSGGLRVNPNLYESGKVCLSLLNTWQGTGTEVWNPESSNILQVLLSLQALVLNEKPYFNEAGYDKQMGRAEGEKNSVSYNENAFLATWKSMLYLLRNPPKHFEELVEEHVRQRSHYILSSCKAYLEGAPLAFALECGQTEDGDPIGSSTGFKIMLAKLLPKLVEAFSGKEIDCSQFTQLEK